jgi:hypothetical protein
VGNLGLPALFVVIASLHAKEIQLNISSLTFHPKLQGKFIFLYQYRFMLFFWL